MPSNKKTPGDGTLRASIGEALSEAEGLAAVFRDALDSGQDGVEDAFFKYKKFFRSAIYDRTDYKCKNNSTKDSSSEATASLHRQADMVLGADMSAYPQLVKEIDPSEIGRTRSMIEACIERMEDANRIQTAKGRRSTPP